MYVRVCPALQVKHGFWFYPVLGITEKYMCRYPPVPLLRDLLLTGGCSTVQSYVQLDRVLMDYKLYSNVEGALEQTWRRGDSG